MVQHLLSYCGNQNWTLTLAICNVAVTLCELAVAVALPVCLEWQSYCLEQKWVLALPMWRKDVDGPEGRGAGA